jgi:hypothetical protein
MKHFLWGALAMSSLVATMFFWRFGRETRDRLFFLFAAAFFLLGVHWVLLALLVEGANEHLPLAYGVRLVAFGLFLAGIIDKNRRTP